MAGTVKKLQFSEGTDVGSPTDLSLQGATTAISPYASDSDFVTAYGDANEGDIYVNTGTEKIRYYMASAWRNVVSESDPTDATKRFSLDLSGMTTGCIATFGFLCSANRTYAFPDATTTLVGDDTPQTLTAKRLTSPKINEDVALTATATELNYIDGVTSAVQTQLDARVVGPSSSVNSELALFDGTTGKLVKSATGNGPVVVTDGVYSTVTSVSATEVGYLDGVTSAIQTQLDAKLCATSVTSVSSDVALTNKSIHLVDTSSARSLTLPAPAAGAFMVVKDSTGGAGTNAITLVRSASEKIETVSASFVLSESLGSWTIVSNGTDWFIC